MSLYKCHHGKDYFTYCMFLSVLTGKVSKTTFRRTTLKFCSSKIMHHELYATITNSVSNIVSNVLYRVQVWALKDIEHALQDFGIDNIYCSLLLVH